MPEREQVFESKGAKLYGALGLPEFGIDNSPACLLINGSLPQTRDGNPDNSHTDFFPNPLPQRNLFIDEAKVLQQIGFVTFRYDKRGCGKSEGNFNSTGLLDFVEDARNALDFLRSLPEINPRQTGVLGQSEGSAIALMLAAHDPEISFCILQGSYYHSLEYVVRWQAENFWKMPQEAQLNIKEAAPIYYWSYQQLDDLIAAVERDEDSFSYGDETWSMNWDLKWWIEHLENPPNKFVNQVHCPVLFLQGESDHNTSAEEVPLLEEALIKAGNNNVTVHIFPGLDHSFRRLGHPDEDFVTAMKRPLDPVMIQALRDWLMLRTT